MEMLNYMTNDFIADAINAFVNKSVFSTECSANISGLASYQVSKDFSNVVATFNSFIGGHVHKDFIWKHQTYTYQYQVTPICSNTTLQALSKDADLRMTLASEQKITSDALTTVSFGENRIGLIKLGVNVTDTGERRDYEVIIPNTQQ